MEETLCNHKCEEELLLGNQSDERCLGDILTLKMQSVNYWIPHCFNHELCHIIISRGIDALTNVEQWWKKQAKAAAGLWRKMLLRETQLPDTAIIQTTIVPMTCPPSL